MRRRCGVTNPAQTDGQQVSVRRPRRRNSDRSKPEKGVKQKRFPGFRGMDAVQSAQVADMGVEHSAGACVVERDRGEMCSPSPPTKQRSLRVVYVLNDGLKSVMASSPETGALQCLQRACDAESALLTTVTFGRLDFGETSVLDSFYDAGMSHRNTPELF